MSKSTQQVAVIGSGVIGLTSAYRLLEAGYQVTVLARMFPPHTTSDVAAAFWSPTATASGGAAEQWALASLDQFRHLATDPTSGIALVDLYKLTPTPTPMPYMASSGMMTPTPPGRFPAPWSGYYAPVPRIDVPVYMPWLLAQVCARGAVLQQQIIQRLAEVGDTYDIIVNCSGLGAHLLTGDALFPIRGQVMSVRKPPDLPTDIIYADDGDTTTYIIPRSGDCLLGGTYQYRDGNTEVDEQIAAQIIARCAHFNPALAQPEILAHKVGLRPGRATVRLEAAKLPTGQLLIHNYGHGSVGHTLAWGCATAVVDLVQRVHSARSPH